MNPRRGGGWGAKIGISNLIYTPAKKTINTIGQYDRIKYELTTKGPIEIIYNAYGNLSTSNKIEAYTCVILILWRKSLQ